MIKKLQLHRAFTYLPFRALSTICFFFFCACSNLFVSLTCLLRNIIHRDTLPCFLNLVYNFFKLSPLFLLIYFVTVSLTNYWHYQHNGKKYDARLSWKFDKHICLYVHINIDLEVFLSNIENISWWGEYIISWFLLLL